MPERSDELAQYDKDGELIFTGSANAYVAATGRQISGYYQGLRICGKANFTNSGAATLDVNGLGAVAIRKLTSVALLSGDMISGQYYDFVYDFTNGWFQLLNPENTGTFVLKAGDTMAGRLDIAAGAAGSSTEFQRWMPTDWGTNKPYLYAKSVSAQGWEIGNWDGTDLNGTLALLFFGGATLNGNDIVAPASPAQGDVIYRDASSWVRLAAGTSGQFLKTNGANANPAWTDNPPLTLMTEQATTSGTTIDFTSIPATAQRITIMFNEVSLSGTNNLLVQIGDSGGIETSGYVSSGDAGGAQVNSTAGFIMAVALAARITSGHMLLTKMNSSGLWISSHSIKQATGATGSGGGSKTLSGTLDRVRILSTPAADTFDGGSVNVMWE